LETVPGWYRVAMSAAALMQRKLGWMPFWPLGLWGITAGSRENRNDRGRRGVLRGRKRGDGGEPSVRLI